MSLEARFWAKKWSVFTVLSRAKTVSRDSQGRFTKGCPPGPGRPKKAYSAVELRRAVLEAVTAEDIREIVQGLVARAKDGNLVAAREVLNRILGPPVEIDLLERLQALEERLRYEPTTS